MLKWFKKAPQKSSGLQIKVAPQKLEKILEAASKVSKPLVDSKKKKTTPSKAKKPAKTTTSVKVAKQAPKASQAPKKARCPRINVTLNRDLLQAIDKKRGKTPRSAFIRYAVLKQLQK